MLTMHTDTQYKPYLHVCIYISPIAVKRESEHAACMLDIIGQTHHQSQCSEVQILDNHLNKLLEKFFSK